ncbi:MAG: hypothetical protein ACYDCO_27595 [Armatimonadota bacterium]
MNRSVIKARLSDIIAFIKDEQKKHPTEWYPIDFFQELYNIICDADDMNMLSEIRVISYHMVDQFFDYRDIACEVIMKFCDDIEKMIALQHALSIVRQAGYSKNVVQMKRLLSEWTSKFPDNGDIPEDIELKFSIEFVNLFNMTPRYWNKVFPDYLKRSLPSGSGLELK